MTWLTPYAFGALRALIPVALLACNSAWAQVWPAKPLRIIAPQPPGGGPDRVLRAMAVGLQQRLGQPVLLEHKPGAGGNLGAAETVRGGADGYTLMLAQDTVQTLNPLIYRNLGYSKADLVPLSLVGSFTQVLACHPSVGVTSLAELVAKAKSSKLTYASGGQGSPGHVTMEMLLAEARIDISHIPYKGPAPAVQDLLGGQVHCGFLVSAIVAEHIKTGKLVGLATSGIRKSVALPQLPTVAESGYAGFDATFWLTLFAPRGLQADVQQKLLKATQEVVRSPEVREAMLANDTIPEVSTLEATQKEVDAAALRWSTLAKRIQLTVD